MKLDDRIWWMRSTGPDGVECVEMYYKGMCDRADEGMIGQDVKVRPVRLGPGEYTMVVSGDCVLDSMRIVPLLICEECGSTERVKVYGSVRFYNHAEGGWDATEPYMICHRCEFAQRQKAGQ